MRGYIRWLIQAGGLAFYSFPPVCSLNVDLAQLPPRPYGVLPPRGYGAMPQAPYGAMPLAPYGGAMPRVPYGGPPRAPYGAMPQVQYGPGSAPRGRAPTPPPKLPAGIPPHPRDPRIAKSKVAVATMGKHGDYGMHAVSQRAYLQMLLPDIMAEVKEGFSIYDLGCADGINSMMIMSAIRKEVSNFTAGFVDVPENDWDTAHFILGSQMDRLGPDTGFLAAPQSAFSFIGEGGGAAGALIAGDFYKQVAPDATYDVGFSGTSVHLLSDGTPATRRGVAARDWLSFLQQRARELRPGGSLHVSALAGRDAEDQLSPPRSYKAVDDVLGDSLRRAAQMGLIPPGAAANWSFPCYARIPTEWKQPFEEKEVANMVMEKFELVAVRSPYWKMANESAPQFAALYVPSVMGWLGPYMQHKLGVQTVRLFAEDLRERVTSAPAQFVDDYLEAVMKIRRMH